MKKLISFILAVLLCMGLFSAVTQASPSTNYTLTGNQLEDMIAVANAQEGKHASDFGFNSEWCAYFVAWCGKIAAPAMFPSSWSSLGTPKHVAVYLCNNYNGTLYYFSNSVTNSLNLNNITWDPNWNTGNYVQTSQSSFTPQRGDLICFHWGSGSFSWDHIGIVTAVNGSTVYYTDGNTGSGSSYTTRTVIVGHSISRSSSEIIGYIRPNYAGSQNALYYLDVNGYVDDNDSIGNIEGYGTFDMYINGSLVANDVSDYFEQWPYGTRYEIADVRAVDGKVYLGPTQGEMSGTITDATQTRLHFATPFTQGNNVIPDGKYRIVSALDTRYAVGIPSYSSTNGDNVQLYQWSDNDPTSTVFEIKNIGNGFYTINSSYVSNFALNCSARGSKKGTNVLVWDYSTDNSQLWAQWVFQPLDNGAYMIYARHCGLAMGVYGGSAATGANIQLYVPAGSPSLQFYLEPVQNLSIKVTFDANGGKVSPSSQSVTLDSTYGTLPKPTRSGYRFGGWYTKASGGTLVKADTTVTKTYDHTLYAHWTKVESQSEETVTGWQKEDGKWYYYNTDGERLTGWQKISGKWYYLGKDGVMTKGWQKVSGKWYYLGTNGVMTTGWQQISGKWYYLGTNGVMTTGWQKVDGKWYYLGTDGVMTTGWQKISGKWYYMDGSGIMQTGWLKSGGKWYYLGTNGVMTTGWQQVSGKWYYMDGSGVMQTGWLQSGGKWYYLNSSGVMTTGWQKVGGKWYYMDSSGVMLTGWQKVSGQWYYLGTNGVMVTGTQTIGGKTYTFNASGVWVS